jgi:hypothetical protein
MAAIRPTVGHYDRPAAAPTRLEFAMIRALVRAVSHLWPSACPLRLGFETSIRQSACVTTLLTIFLICPAISPAAAQALVVDARRFVTAPHAGTVDDPWPGSAIAAAIASLPDGSGTTVVLAPGIWRIDSEVRITTSGITLSGSDRAATIALHGDGRLLVAGNNPSAVPVRAVRLIGLRIDATGLAVGAAAPIHLRNCVDCRVTDSFFGPRPNSGPIAILLYEGGGAGRVSGNDFVDSYLQLNPLGGSANADFMVSGNTFESSGILVIGLSQVSILGNTLTNRTLGNFIGIRVAPPYRGGAKGIRIERNIIDATTVRGRENGVLISGLPQDPGGAGSLRGLYIRDNILRGTSVNINAQVGAAGRSLEECIASCQDLSDVHDLRIRGNTAEALWGGVVIDLRGGQYGIVDGGRVFGNKLNSQRAGAVHRILADQNTRNVTIGRNPSAQPIVISP